MRTFTLGQRGRGPGDQLHAGYMMEYAAPPPAYEHVVLAPQPGGSGSQNAVNSNNSDRTAANEQTPNQLNDGQETFQRNANERRNIFRGETESPADRIPRYQSVMRKGRWSHTGSASIWTSTDEITSQSTETLNTTLGSTSGGSVGNLTDVSSGIDSSTRISDTNQEFVTHL